MKIQSFKLERYLARYEFSAPYLMCCSDCEPLTLKELLALTDKESLSLWENLQLGYTDSRGHHLLREEISRLYDNITPENLLVTCPEEGIFLTMNILLDPGDHIVVTFPGYQSLYEIADSIGCTVTRWQPQEGKEWKFDVTYLESAIRKNTKLLVVNFPHNPTGALPEREDYNLIVKMAKENNIFLFSDEMYRFLEYDERDRLPSGAEIYENGLSLFGMSKTFSLAGLRLGWLVTRNRELLDKLLAFKDYTTICSSAPSEILALMALRARDKIIARNLEIIKNNLSLLDRFFDDHPDVFSWNRPKAGSIALPRLLLKERTSLFCRRLREEKGVVLLPSRVYDYGEGHFRVGFGRRDMSNALTLLEDYLDR
ncbi:MAG: aminotransferase class I/II-fold pyridoxal phosphate-dependent enzyme [Candidatus Aminicenantes bacterium]|nr:aminotransferase class I/II-fold pyridoxal phosphate-dependent enzyme [Candidatus Aminicenantes bacterium]